MLAFAILLPLASWVLRPSSGLWPHWRRFALLGLLGVGGYNALQYLALQTSTPLNVTLVASSIPLWMLAIGALFFGVKVTRRTTCWAPRCPWPACWWCSRAANWAQLLQLRLVTGDLFMLLATAAWAWYSWLLTRRDEPPAIRSDWAAFLMAQMVFGLVWSGAVHGRRMGADRRPHRLGLAAGGHAGVRGHRPGRASPTAAGAWACSAPGPTVAGFFANLTPLFAALMSAAFLGETPQPYHAAGVRADRGRDRGVVAALKRSDGDEPAQRSSAQRLNTSPDRRRRPAGCSAR